MAVRTRLGCPLCGGLVTGNAELRFLCGQCHLLFDERHLRGLSPRSPQHVEEVEEYEEVFAPEPLAPAPFVRSEHSESYHVRGCKYARRIEDPVPVRDPEGFRACKCVKQYA